MPYNLDDPLASFDLPPVDTTGLLDALGSDPVAGLENELLKLETSNVQTRAQQRKDYIDRIKSIFAEEPSPEQSGNTLAKRRKKIKLRPSERAALVISALADVGAGAFGVKSRSFEDMQTRNRKDIEDYTDRTQKNALNTAQLEAGAQNQNADDEMGLARLKMNTQLQRARDEQQWAQNLLQATSPEALYEHARKAAIAKAKAQAEIESQGMAPGTYEKKINLDQLLDEQASDLVPASMRDPQTGQLTRQGALMAQGIQGKIREGKVKYEENLVTLRDSWAQKINNIMDSAEPDKKGNPIPSPLDEYGLQELQDADTPEAVGQVGRRLMARASELAQRSRGNSQLNIGVKSQLDAQRKLLADARAAGVDFNALELTDLDESGKPTPLVWDNGEEVKNPLQRDPTVPADKSKAGSDGLLHPMIIQQLENEVARMKTIDPKAQNAGLRALKQTVAQASKDAEEFALEQIAKGRVLEDIQQDIKDMVYSKYGLTGKWAAEAEKIIQPLLQKYSDVFGRVVEESQPKDQSYPAPSRYAKPGHNQ